MFNRMSQGLGDIEAGVTKVGASRITDGDDLAFRLGKKLGRVRTDIAKALNGDTCAGGLASQPAEQLEREQADAAAGRLLAARDSVILDRFARHHARIEAVVFV